MDKNSPRFTLSSQDKQTIVTVVIHGLVGIVLTLIPMVFLHLNYGDFTPLITTALSLISLALTSYLNGPSQATLRIQELEQLVQQLQQPQQTQPEVPQPPTA